MGELFSFAGGSLLELKEVKKLSIEEYYIYLDSQYREPQNNIKMPNELNYE